MNKPQIFLESKSSSLTLTAKHLPRGGLYAITLYPTIFILQFPTLELLPLICKDLKHLAKGSEDLLLPEQVDITLSLSNISNKKMFLDAFGINAGYILLGTFLCLAHNSKIFFLLFSTGSFFLRSLWHEIDADLIPGLGRSPGEGKGYPFQYPWASLVAQW